jgi:DNA-binding NarL/FixJ family response regulator
MQGLLAENVVLSITSGCGLLRDVLACRLRAEPGIELAAVAASLDDLLADPRGGATRVLLLHATDPDAAEIVAEITVRLPSARVVVLCDVADGALALGCLEAGAAACMGHDAPYASLLDAVRAASRGQTTASLALVAAAARRIRDLQRAAGPTERVEPEQPLSDRECEVADLLGEGLANKQIARRLRIKPQTVKSHVHNVLQKLHVKRRHQVVLQGSWGGTV